MIVDRIVLCLFGISSFFAVGTVGIIGGKIATADQFPYQVSLYTGKNVCGGGIIGEQHILTAAHCVINEQGAKRFPFLAIIAGTNDLGKMAPPAQFVDVEKFYVNADFLLNVKTNIADIAVVKLKRALPLSKHIQKLQLPESNHETYTGSIAKIAGFGWDYAKTQNSLMAGGHSDDQLRYSKVDILGDAHKCYHITTNADKQICGRLKQHVLRRSDVAVSYGDSGSPLVVNGTVAIGVLSTGPFGGSEKIIGAQYTRVSSFLQFINNAKHDKIHDGIRVYEIGGL